MLADLEEFVSKHRPHGPLTGDASEPTEHGYMVSVGCVCGVVFLRGIPPVEATLDLLRLADARECNSEP